MSDPRTAPPRPRPTGRRALGLALAAALGAGCSTSDDPCAFATDGAPWVAFCSLAEGSWDVEVIRADGTCRRALGHDPAVDLHPSWTATGLLAYDSTRAPGPGLWLHDLGAGTERRLDLGALGATSPAFSPDGATLAFEGRLPGSTDGSIYLVPAAGGAPVLLTPATPGGTTPAASGNGGPSFSPDGATVYFVSNRAGPYDVWRVPAAGGDAVRVTTGSGIIGKPAVSPDGRSLAYARAAPGSTTEVVLLDLESGQVTPFGGTGRSEPAFDPAGGRLALRVQYLLTTTIDLAPLDGSPGLRLTTGPGPDGAPAFAPARR
jgi:TolB protein